MEEEIHKRSKAEKKKNDEPKIEGSKACGIEKKKFVGREGIRENMIVFHHIIYITGNVHTSSWNVKT